MAVKVIIRRRVGKEKESSLMPLLLELRGKAMAQPGYISGETLRNVKDSKDFLVIGTWQSAEAWQAWEDNPERVAIQKSIDALLDGETSCRVYFYG